MKKVVIYIRMGRKENNEPEKQLNVLSIAHRFDTPDRKW